MATMVIHWKDKDIPNMESKGATYKGLGWFDYQNIIHMKHIMALNIDEQQKAFMGEIRSRMMKETIRKIADIRTAQIELKDLLSQDTVY